MISAAHIEDAPLLIARDQYSDFDHSRINIKLDNKNQSEIEKTSEFSDPFQCRFTQQL